MMMMSALTEQAEKTDSSEIFRKQLRMVADIINASQSEMRAPTSSSPSESGGEEFETRN